MCIVWISSLIFECKITAGKSYNKKTRGPLYEHLALLYVMTIVYARWPYFILLNTTQGTSPLPLWL